MSEDTSKLNVPKIRKQFQLELKNRFSCLVVDDCDENRLEGEGDVARENEVEKKVEKDQSHLLRDSQGCARIQNKEK